MGDCRRIERFPVRCWRKCGGFGILRALVAVTVSLLLAGAAGAASNDAFANAISVSLGSSGSTVSSVGFTKEVGEPAALAGTGGASAWWTWTATSNAPVAVSTAGSSYDTVLDVWTGTSVSNLSLVTFSDDYSYGTLVNGFARTSMAVFTPVINTVYHFRVDGYVPGGSGTIVFALQPVPAVSIAATTPDQEGSANPGVWTVSLSSPLADTVPITFGVTGGTAPSAHYTIAQSSPLLLAGGSSATTITLTSTDDGQVTGNLTVITSISASGYQNYSGTPSATLTIVDAESPMVYVNAAATGANTGTSWANAFPDLHTALATSVSGNQLWVARATYSTTAQSDSFHLLAGVPLYGGFTGSETALAQRNRFLNPTILSGSYGAGLHSYHVVTGADNATLDGVTVTGGNASGSNFPDMYGGGLVSFNVTTLIHGCVFSGNSALSAGGGVFLLTSAVTPSITTSYFIGNACTAASSPYGGGAVLIDNNASSSTAGAITNCVFAANTCACNTATAGVGPGGAAIIAASFASGAITNCTFASNASAGCGGAICNNGSQGLSITNSIFSGNTAAEGGNSLGTSTSFGPSPSQTATSCLFQESTLEAGFANGGGNLINVSPQFANASNPAGADGIYGTVDDGLALTAGSPAVDSGTSAGAPAVDISSHGRPLGLGYDMGAYELGAVLHVTPSGTGNGSSWSSPTTLALALATALNGDEIWVAGGTHAPTAGSAANTFQLVSGVNVYGGFHGNEATRSARNVPANPTVLSGLAAHNYHVVTGADNSRLDGFIISGGDANGSPSLAIGGGGLLCNGTSPTIAGCVFSANAASQDGGAAYIHNPCAPIFINCVFSGNSATTNGGAIECELGANPSFTNCTFSGNSCPSARGGAIETYSNANFSLLNCVLWNDTTPEIYNNGSSPSASFSDLQGGLVTGVSDGGGNFNLDPQFVGPSTPAGADGVFIDEDDGFMPSGASPCLGAGTASGAPASDIVGNARPLITNAAITCGAYEVPTVTVIASIPSAVKPALSGSPSNGQFLVIRNGDLTLPMTVSVTIGGTAIAGTDYLPIVTPVVIPAGAASVVVPVTLIATSQAGNPATVVMTLTPSAPGSIDGYVAAPAQNHATVLITNLNTAGVVITPLGPFTGAGSNVLLTQQAGSTATFTVRLNSQPTASVTVNLASSNVGEGTINKSSITFTTGNWNSPVSVLVSGVADYIAHGPQAYQLQSSGAISSDPFYSRSSTTITPSQQSVFPTSIPYVVQSGANWQVKVAGAGLAPSAFTVANAGGTATISLAAPVPSGQSVQIQYLGEVSLAANGSTTAFDTAFPFVLATANAWLVTVNGAIQPTSAYVISANGLNNGRITFSSAPAAGTVLVQTDVVAAVNANTNLRGVTVTPGSLNLTEGGVTANYTVVLTSQPSNGNVVITLSAANLAIPGANNIFTSVSSLTFTPTFSQSVSGTTSGWNVPQTVTVSASRDFNVEPTPQYGGIVTQAVTAAPTCDYNGFAAQPVTLTVTDVDSAQIVLTPPAGLVTSEAGTQTTFQVTLNSRPKNPVTLTLQCEDTLDSGSNENGGVFYTGTALPHSATITLTFSPTDGLGTSGTPGAQTSGWNVPQTITLQGLRGTVGVQGNTPYTVNLTSAPAVAGSGDSSYSSLSAGVVMTILNTDIDVPGVLISAGTLSVVRGDPIGTSFTVQLATDPTTGATGAAGDNVVIEFSDTMGGLVTLSPAILVFTHATWNTPVTVQVTAPDNGVVEAQIQSDTLDYTVISGNSAYNTGNGSLPVTVQDSGVAGLVISPTVGLVTGEDGTRAAFQVGLLSRPAGTGTVTATLTSSNPGAGVLGLQFYSSDTTTSGATSTIDLPLSTDLTAVAPAMLVAYSGLGSNSGALSLVTAVGPGAITIAPAVLADPAVETVTVLPALGIGSGSSTASSPVVSFPIGTDLSQVFEGQEVLVMGAGGPTASSSSTVRYVDRVGLAVTLAADVPAGSNETAYFSTGPLSLSWTAAAWQTVKTVTVIGMHNRQVNGNVTYQVTAAAISADPHYNTSQTMTSGVATTDFSSAIPFATYSGSNWVASVGGSLVGGFTITNLAGYAHLSLASATTGPVVLTYLPTVALTNLDIDHPGFVVTPLDATSIFPSPGSPSTAHFSITLTSEPVGDVDVDIQSSNTAKGVVSPPSLTFTQSTPHGGSGWDQPHLVTITAVGSQVADGAVSFSVTPLPATSVDPIYNTLQASGVSLATVDPAIAGITVTPVTALTTNAQSGLTAQFRLVLTSQPTSTVVIPLATSDPGKGTPSAATLTFTAQNWNVAQTVTVTGVANAVAEGPVPYQIVFSQPQTVDPAYAVLITPPVTIIGTDNNMAGYIISDPTSQSGHIFDFTTPPVDPPLQTTDLGGTAAFQVALTSQPAGADLVTITLSSSDTSLGTPSPGTLVFSANNWNTPQVVTVTGGNAGFSDTDGTYTITSSSVVSTDPFYNDLLLVQPVPGIPCLNVAQNKIPTLDPIAGQSVLENQASLPVVSLTGITTGEASAVHALQVTATSDNQALLPDSALLVGYTAVTPVPSTGTLAFSPVHNQFGTAHVTVTVTSIDTSAPPLYRGGTKSASQSFSITVGFVNQPPSFVPGANQSVLEGVGAQTAPAWATAISVGPPNESSQHGTFLITNDNNALFMVQPAVDPISGDLTYTPAPTAFGVANVAIFLQDDGGTANGGSNLSATTHFTITVTSVNHAPTFTDGANLSIQEGSGPQTDIGWATGISPGPADESGQTLAFSCADDQPGLFSVQPVLDLAGTLSFTPLPTARGFATVTVTLMDNGGTANGGVDTTVQTFTITINPTNDAPLVSMSAPAGRQVPIGSMRVIQPTDLWATDVDSAIPAPAHDPGLVFTVQLAPGNGSLFDHGAALAVNGTFTQQDIINGWVSYTHNGGTSASDGFAFTVADSPIPAGSVLASPMLPATTLPPGVSALQVFSISIDRSDPVVTLTPAGPLPFLDQGPAELIAPTGAVSDPTQPSFSGGQLLISFASGASLADVIAIDTTGSVTLTGSNVFYDDGGGPQLFGTLSVTQGAGGTVMSVSGLTAVADTTSVSAFIQRLTFQNTAISPSNPTSNPITDRVIQVQVTDANNDSSLPADLTVAVTSVPHPPQIISGAVLVTAENVPISGTVNAIDVDGNTLSYAVTGTTTLGTVAINSATGAYTFTPVAGITGTGSFHVQVSDGVGGSAGQDISVLITADSPLEPFITSNPPQATQQNDTVIYNVVSYAPGTAAPDFSIIGLAAGTYTLGVSGSTATLTLLPTATATAGYVTFSILITDPAHALSGVQPVTLLVAATPAAGG